jgi:hypothetical protein
MIHDPLCHNPEPLPEGMACGWCYQTAKVRKAIVDGLKVGLPPSDTRDAAVSIATFAVSST